jgi:hypothetical protein
MTRVEHGAYRSFASVDLRIGSIAVVPGAMQHRQPAFRRAVRITDSGTVFHCFRKNAAIDRHSG